MPLHYNNRQYELVYFMHIGKTAGTSVGKWMREHDIKLADGGCHGNHVIVRDFDPDIFYFTVVRNPYDRVASAFFQWEKNEFWRPGIKTPNDVIDHLSLGRGIEEMVTYEKRDQWEAHEGDDKKIKIL